MSSSVLKDNELNDVEFKPKGFSNGRLAELSKSEKRVLVTNDEDFAEFTKEEIHSVIWLLVSA